MFKQKISCCNVFQKMIFQINWLTWCNRFLQKKRFTTWQQIRNTKTKTFTNSNGGNCYIEGMQQNKHRKQCHTRVWPKTLRLEVENVTVASKCNQEPYKVHFTVELLHNKGKETCNKAWNNEGWLGDIDICANF